MKIEVGTVLRDNDPRFKGRTVVVAHVGASYVDYQGKSRYCTLRLDRIFSDGKKRAQGWNVVTDPAVARVNAAAPDYGTDKAFTFGG